jgi:hypothetical protein
MIINAFRARPTGFSKIVAARYALTTEHKIARPINVRLAIFAVRCIGFIATDPARLPAANERGSSSSQPRDLEAVSGRIIREVGDRSQVVLALCALEGNGATACGRMGLMARLIW